MSPPLKNVGGWRLNASEKAELDRRVKAGETEAVVKRELQTKKAQACEDRKAAAQAVSTKCVKQQAKAKAKAKAKTSASAAGPSGGPAPAAAADADLDAAANKAYYCQVHADITLVLSEFGGEAFRQEAPLQIHGDQTQRVSGVQEPFDRTKALQALSAHGCYRCSISVWWLNAMQSPTPGVPMSRKRVEDLRDFYYGPEGLPRFHSDRMVEVAVAPSDCDTDTPSNLQIISPEEMVHATFAGCVRAIEFLGFTL